MIFSRLLSLSCLGMLAASMLPSCTSGVGLAGGSSGAPNMGSHPTPALRAQQIAAEPSGSFYYGRRYFINKARFWGYVRSPQQPWSQSTLVIMHEGSTLTPDRLPEDGPGNSGHGYDQNFDYQISGSYTGRRIYDPASNLFIREFRPTSFKVVDRNPGWLFSPKDHYDPYTMTIINDSVRRN